MLWAAYSCPLPLVGRLHGDCYAGGVGLAAVCDVLVAAEGMHFCLSEAKLGLLPATIGPYVVRALGAQAARRYFITAERFSAARRRRWASCTNGGRRGAGRHRGGHRGRAGGQRPCGRARPASGWCRIVAGREIDAALRDDTARRIADIRASDEGREGMSMAFLDKR